MGTSCEDHCTFLIISSSVLLRMRNVSDQSCRENQNTHFMLNILFPPENLAVYEMTWKGTVGHRPQMTTRRMRIACWIPKATNAQSEYVKFIALLLQQWLYVRALCYVVHALTCFVFIYVGYITTVINFKLEGDCCDLL